MVRVALAGAAVALVGCSRVNPEFIDGVAGGDGGPNDVTSSGPVSTGSADDSVSDGPARVDVPGGPEACVYARDAPIDVGVLLPDGMPADLCIARAWAQDGQLTRVEPGRFLLTYGCEPTALETFTILMPDFIGEPFVGQCVALDLEYGPNGGPCRFTGLTLFLGPADLPSVIAASDTEFAPLAAGGFPVPMRGPRPCCDSCPPEPGAHVLAPLDGPVEVFEGETFALTLDIAGLGFEGEFKNVVSQDEPQPRKISWVVFNSDGA